VGSSALTGLLAAIAAVAAASAFGLWWRRRNGRVVAQPPAQPAGVDVEGEALARLGVAAGTPVTLLQFSSAFCAPCRLARRICADLAGQRDGVAHLEVDAESHLDEVRALGVWRTPTVLVVDAEGRIAFRLTGAPTRAGLAAAVESLTAEAVGR
jgi:thioredoxin family protein